MIIDSLTTAFDQDSRLFLVGDEWTSAGDKSGLTPILCGFDPITLEEIGRNHLLNRVEVKYVAPACLLRALLLELRDSYRVLIVGDSPLSGYRTLYFDTTDFALYRRHHAGALSRYKIRAREYLSTGHSFLEVKQKTNRNRTIKHRIETSSLITELHGDAARFVASVYPHNAAQLQPRLWSNYTRITLQHKREEERITFDLDLSVGWENAWLNMPEIVVAEVKQHRSGSASEFMQLIRRYRIRPTAFSKYCSGAARLYPGLKSNRFKAKERMLAKLAQGEAYAAA